jgi:hypothetical protein
VLTPDAVGTHCSLCIWCSTHCRVSSQATRPSSTLSTCTNTTPGTLIAWCAIHWWAAGRQAGHPQGDGGLIFQHSPGNSPGQPAGKVGPSTSSSNCRGPSLGCFITAIANKTHAIGRHSTLHIKNSRTLSTKWMGRSGTGLAGDWHMSGVLMYISLLFHSGPCTTGWQRPGRSPLLSSTRRVGEGVSVGRNSSVATQYCWEVMATRVLWLCQGGSQRANFAVADVEGASVRRWSLCQLLHSGWLTTTCMSHHNLPATCRLCRAWPVWVTPWRICHWTTLQPRSSMQP